MKHAINNFLKLLNLKNPLFVFSLFIVFFFLIWSIIAFFYFFYVKSANNTNSPHNNVSDVNDIEVILNSKLISSEYGKFIKLYTDNVLIVGRGQDEIRVSLDYIYFNSPDRKKKCDGLENKNCQDQGLGNVVILKFYNVERKENLTKTITLDFLDKKHILFNVYDYAFLLSDNTDYLSYVELAVLKDKNDGVKNVMSDKEGEKVVLSKGDSFSFNSKFRLILRVIYRESVNTNGRKVVLYCNDLLNNKDQELQVDSVKEKFYTCGDYFINVIGIDFENYIVLSAARKK